MYTLWTRTRAASTITIQIKKWKNEKRGIIWNVLQCVKIIGKWVTLGWVRAHFKLIVAEIIFLKAFFLKNIYYAVLYILPCNLSLPLFPEVFSSSTISFHEAFSISTVIICLPLKRTVLLSFMFVLPITGHMMGS